MEHQEDRDALQAVADEELKKRYGHLPVGSQMHCLAEVVFRHTLDYALNKPGTYGPDDFSHLLDRTGNFLEDLRKELNPLSTGGFASDNDSWKATYTKYLFEHERSTNPDEWLSFLYKHVDYLNLHALFEKGTESESYWPTGDLSEICVRYLTEPWLHCTQIDRLLIHTMIYQKVIGFGEDIKPKILGKKSFFRALPLPSITDYQKELSKVETKIVLWGITWTILSGLVGIGVTAVYGWGLGALAAFGFYMLSVANNFSGKWELQKNNVKMMDLLNDIHRAYALMHLSPLSPLYLRERLLALAHKGVSWPVGIFPILDNAIVRDPILWGTRRLFNSE